MEGGGIGSDPFSFLLLRSNARRLVHGRITGSWWKPVRKLKTNLDSREFFLLEFDIHFGIRPEILLLESTKYSNSSSLFRKSGNSYKSQELSPKT